MAEEKQKFRKLEFFVTADLAMFNDPRLILLEQDLKIARDALFGMVLSSWLWVLQRNSPEVKGYTPSQLVLFFWHSIIAPPDGLGEALVKVGFWSVLADGTLFCNDWDHISRYLKKNELKLTESKNCGKLRENSPVKGAQSVDEDVPCVSTDRDGTDVECPSPVHGQDGDVCTKDGHDTYETKVNESRSDEIRSEEREYVSPSGSPQTTNSFSAGGKSNSPTWDSTHRDANEKDLLELRDYWNDTVGKEYPQKVCRRVPHKAIPNCLKTISNFGTLFYNTYFYRDAFEQACKAKFALPKAWFNFTWVMSDATHLLKLHDGEYEKDSKKSG